MVPEFTEEGRSTLQKQINKTGYKADVTDADTSKVPQRGRTLGHGMLNLEDTDDKTTSEMKRLKGGGVYISEAFDATTKEEKTFEGGTLLFGTALDFIKEGYKRIKDGVLNFSQGNPNGIPAKDKSATGGKLSFSQGDPSKIPSKDKASTGGKLSYSKGDTTSIPAKDKKSGSGSLSFSSADTSKIPAEEKVVRNAKAAVSETDFLKVPFSKKVLGGTTAKITDVKDSLEAKKREIKNGKYIANDVKDSIPDRKRDIKNARAVFTGKEDKITNRTFGRMTARFTEKIDGIANRIFNKGMTATFTAKNDNIANRTFNRGMTANFTTKNDNISNRNFGGMSAGFKDFWLQRGWSWDIKGMYAGFKDWWLQKGWSWDIKGMNAVFWSNEVKWHPSWYKIYGMIAVFNGNSQAKGGVFSGGSWKSLPQYAGGGSPTHGTIFAAGENGAEIVGTVGGRTEVLNKSQIAMAIYNAVRSAMQGFGMDIVKQIAYDSSVLSAHIDAVANYIPDVNHITQANRIYAKAEGIDYNRLAQALAAQGGDNNTYVFTAQLDGREIFRETVSQNDLYRTQTGRSAFA